MSSQARGKTTFGPEEAIDSGITDMPSIDSVRSLGLRLLLSDEVSFLRLEDVTDSAVTLLWPGTETEVVDSSAGGGEAACSPGKVEIVSDVLVCCMTGHFSVSLTH
jgi:hypothetical protein